MLQTDIAKYEREMRRRLRELDGRLDDLEDALDNPVSPNVEERAIEREGDEVMEQLGQAGIEEIAQIKAALVRIKAGAYGICAKCNNEIVAARLDLLPHTPFCQNCA